MDAKTKLDNLQFPMKALVKRVKATMAVPRVALTLKVESSAEQWLQQRFRQVAMMSKTTAKEQKVKQQSKDIT